MKLTRSDIFPYSPIIPQNWHLVEPDEPTMDGDLVDGVDHWLPYTNRPDLESCFRIRHNIHQLKRELPKWTRLLVKGDAVTEKQAMEIILRTNSLDFPDPELNNLFYDIPDKDVYQNLSAKGYNFNEINSYMKMKDARISHLDLSWLSNKRIYDTGWVESSYGWCDWDGSINASKYNIGKWPKATEVYEDWVKIAKAFPFLKLRCQLLSGYDGSSSKAIIEFHVSYGEVKIILPTDIMMPVELPEGGRLVKRLLYADLDDKRVQHPFDKIADGYRSLVEKFR